jgi:hypothetical protein
MDPELEKNLVSRRALGATDDQIRQYAAQWQAAHADTTPVNPADTALSAHNAGRAAVQGATFGFGDELHLTDPKAETAFKKAHPVVDFLSKLGGGIVAPAVATAAAPEVLGTATAAAGIGALTGGLTAAGEDNGGSITDRAKSAAGGAALGAPAALVGYGGAKMIGGGIGAIIDRLFPTRAGTRAVGKAAADILSPSDVARAAARQDAVNAIAPGASSPASAAVPATGKPIPRFTSLVRGVGASPTAAASAEQSLSGQVAAQQAGRKVIGAQIDALASDVPVTPDLVSALSKARVVLGGKAPAVTPETQVVSTNDIREALSQLSFIGRQLEKGGINANGITKNDVQQATSALRSVLYTHEPRFAPLDQQYAQLANETRSTNRLLNEVQVSRRNYPANVAYGTGSGSLGGSLPKGTASAVKSLIDNILTNKTATADAVARMVVRPGASVADLVAAAPGKARVGPAVRTALASQLPAALRGLLFPRDDER